MWIDFVKLDADNHQRLRAINFECYEAPMAENESLDLGGAYAKRWDVPFESIRRGASCKDAAKKVEGALYSGLRNTLKQLSTEYGVSLQDLLDQGGSPQGLRQLIRRTHGHQYVELFAAAASIVDTPSAGECLRGWVDAIIDRVFDQISHRVAGKDNLPSFFDVHDSLQEIRQVLEPTVKRIVANFEKDTTWTPKRPGSKGQKATGSTAELLGMSLLKGASQ